MDPYNSVASSLDSPARDAAHLTPNDAADVPVVTRAIYVGSAGNVAVEMANGSTVTLNSVPTGSIVPIRIRKLLNTGTTASAIIGLW